ncbi:hypothetical protein LZD49_05415 [Dyadobacter sp. CY261]|uniref:hypothetical protein n=1 Tax=Dyadobacter sp. CY261 TaxID=2907203 RepID=UPI001F170F6E|nr:hypothetical protein [Dyadobacter sp. CY261]
MVQKIIKRYPELGLTWILDEEPLPEIQNQPPLESRKRVFAAPQAAQPSVVKERLPALPEKKIEKVLIFYSDGTFQEFKQG